MNSSYLTYKTFTEKNNTNGIVGPKLFANVSKLGSKAVNSNLCCFLNLNFDLFQFMWLTCINPNKQLMHVLKIKCDGYLCSFVFV